MFNRKEVQKAFDDLAAQIKVIEETSPRLERDSKYPTLTVGEIARYKELIAKHEEGLFELRQQFAEVARVLKALKRS